MTSHRVLHEHDILLCNHGGTVVLLKKVKNRRAHMHKRRPLILCDWDLLNRVTIKGCSIGCTKVVSIQDGLVSSIVLNGDTPLNTELKATTDKGCTVTPTNVLTDQPKGTPTSANDELFQRDTDRASSAKNAAGDAARAQQYVPLAEKVAPDYDVPPALIVGIMSRETHVGSLVEGTDGWGDNHNGYGLMQVDIHTKPKPKGPWDSEDHVREALEIFAQKRDRLKERHPDWSKADLDAAATSRYNGGAPKPGTDWDALDRGTTGGDYGEDTWARSQWFANNLNW